MAERVTGSVRSIGVLTARVAAVACSLTVVTWLVVDAQQRANAPRSDEPAAPISAPDGASTTDAGPIDAPVFTTVELKTDPYIFSSKFVVLPPTTGEAPATPSDPATFLPSSKSKVPLEEALFERMKAAVQQEPANVLPMPPFLHSSKTITPVVTPQPPTLVFPPQEPAPAKPKTEEEPVFWETSKSGKPVSLESSKRGTPASPEPYLPSSKSGRPRSAPSKPAPSKPAQPPATGPKN